MQGPVLSILAIHMYAKSLTFWDSMEGGMVHAIHKVAQRLRDHHFII